MSALTALAEVGAVLVSITLSVSEPRLWTLPARSATKALNLLKAAISGYVLRDPTAVGELAGTLGRMELGDRLVDAGDDRGEVIHDRLRHELVHVLGRHAVLAGHLHGLLAHGGIVHAQLQFGVEQLDLL